MSKKTLIAIEGFDRVGKDTLITTFLQKYSNVKQYKQPTSESVGISYRDTKQFELYLYDHYTQVINELIELSKTSDIVITSRLFVSDKTYSELFGRKYQFGELAEKYNLLKYFNVISYCMLWNSYDEYLKRVGNSNIEYNKEEFIKLNDLFSKNTLALNGYVAYIKNSDSIETNFEKFKKILINKDLI